MKRRKQDTPKKRVRPQGPWCPFPREWDSEFYYDEWGRLRKDWDGARLQEHLQRITSKQWFDEMKSRVKFNLEGFISVDEVLKNYKGGPLPFGLVEQIFKERFDAFRIQQTQRERRQRNPKGKGAGRPKQDGPTVEQRAQDMQCHFAMELLLTTGISQTAAAERIREAMSHANLCSSRAVIEAYNREENRREHPRTSAGILRFDPQEWIFRFDLEK